MDEITIPYHLAIPTIICLIGLGIILFSRKRLFSKNTLLWTSLTVFLVLYLLIVGRATFDTIYYQWDLNRYDLDKDGMFGGIEITDEQNEAMRKLTSDTGRNLPLQRLSLCGYYVLGRLSLPFYKSSSFRSSIMWPRSTKAPAFVVLLCGFQPHTR